MTASVLNGLIKDKNGMYETYDSIQPAANLESATMHQNTLEYTDLCTTTNIPLLINTTMCVSYNRRTVKALKAIGQQTKK